MNNSTDLSSDLDALLNSGISDDQMWMFVDWLVRDQLPRCLDIAGMSDVAGRLRAARPIADFTSLAMISEAIKNAHHKLYADVQRRSLTIARVAAHEASQKAVKEMGSNFTPFVGEPSSTERFGVMAVFVNHVHPAIMWSLWLAAYEAVKDSGQPDAAQAAVQPTIDGVKESGRDLVRRLSSL